MNMTANEKRMAAYQKGFLKAVADHAEAAPPSDEVYRRVAKFLILIGIDEAAKVLSHLPHSQTEKIIPEIASVRRVTPEESSQILDEFQALLQKSRLNGGVSTARTLLESAFGTEKAGQVLEKAVPFPKGKPFAYLDEVDGERLWALLSDESLPIQCMVLSRIRPALAAAALKLADAETKKDIIKRLAILEPIALDMVRRVDRELHEKLLMIDTNAVGEQVDGRGTLSEILRAMLEQTSGEILETLMQTEPALAFDLRSRLFTADDIVSVNDEFVQRELFKLEDAEIAKLIAAKSDRFREKIFQNLSAGRGERVLDEEELGKPFRKIDVDSITGDFFVKVRREWDDGRIVL